MMHILSKFIKRIIRNLYKQLALLLFLCIVLLYLGGKLRRRASLSQIYEVLYNQLVKYDGIEIPNASLNSNFTNCSGLFIASSYIEKISPNWTRIHMVTGHIPWKSFSPFEDGYAFCQLSPGTIKIPLKTRAHYTFCDFKNLPQYESALITIYNENVPACHVLAQKISKKPDKPFKISILTTVKNSETYFLEWYAYNWLAGFSHIFLYDDGSSEYMKKILAKQIEKKFCTVIDWGYVDHPSRQFMAMQDFKIRFGHLTEFVTQMDDDTYWVSRYPNYQIPIAAQIFKFIKERPMNECQWRSGSYWFGNGDIIRRNDVLIKSSLMRATNRLNDDNILWKLPGNNMRYLDSTLSFARVDKILSSTMSHRWIMNECNTHRVNSSKHFFFHHYKIKPFEEYQNLSLWGSTSGSKKYWLQTSQYLNLLRDPKMKEDGEFLNNFFRNRCCKYSNDKYYSGCYLSNLGPRVSLKHRISYKNYRKTLQ